MRVWGIGVDGLEDAYSSIGGKPRPLGITGVGEFDVKGSSILETIAMDRVSETIVIPIGVGEFDGTLNDAIELAREWGQDFIDWLTSLRRNGDKVAFIGLRREHRCLGCDSINHNFNRIELAAGVAKELLPEWVEVDLKKPTLKFLVAAFGDVLLLGFILADKLHKLRRYRIFVHKAGLRPSAAASAVLMRNDVRVYDPMCGNGTIPFEAFAISAKIPILTDLEHSQVLDLASRLSEEPPELFFEVGEEQLGSDVSEKAIRESEVNKKAWMKHLKALGFKHEIAVKFFVADVFFSDPPEAKRIVSNPPYGRRSSRPSILPQLYAALAEYAHNSGAEFLDVFTSKPEVMREATEGLWKLEREVMCLIGSSIISFFMMRRE